MTTDSARVIRIVKPNGGILQVYLRENVEQDMARKLARKLRTVARTSARKAKGN